MLHCPCVVFKFIGPIALLESVWMWPLQPVDRLSFNNTILTWLDVANGVLVKTSFKQLAHTVILNLEAFSF